MNHLLEAIAYAIAKNSGRILAFIMRNDGE